MIRGRRKYYILDYPTAVALAKKLSDAGYYVVITGFEKERIIREGTKEEKEKLFKGENK